MSNRKSRSSRKRKQSLMNQRQSKRKKQEASEQPVSMTKITDINDDCLEHIFKKLKLEDLLNVADASKYFKEVIDQVYKSLYGIYSIKIVSMKPSHDPRLEIRYSSIYISDLSTCLKMLRCFGHLITNVMANYVQGCRRHHNEVDRYLNEYCADSLRSIDFSSARLWTMENIEKPFSNVDAIEFSNSRLGNNLTDFNKWFPQLRHLTFEHGNSVANRTSIEKRFPHLYSLSIKMHKSDKTKFRKSHFAEILHLNPQIGWFKIDGDVLDAKFLHSISEHLQTIGRLEFIWHAKCFNHGGPIHFRNVKNLEFRMYDNVDGEAGGPMPKIPFSFDRLEQLYLNLNKYHLSDDIMNFISMHSTLSRLHFSLGNQFFQTAADKLKLAKSLKESRSLKTIIFSLAKFKVDEILGFVSNCGSVKSFSFQGEDVSKCDRLRENLGGKWRIFYEYGYMELQR